MFPMFYYGAWEVTTGYYSMIGARRWVVGKGFSPSTLWILGIKLWSSDLNISTLPHRVILVAQWIAFHFRVSFYYIYLVYQAEIEPRAPCMPDEHYATEPFSETL